MMILRPSSPGRMEYRDRPARLTASFPGTEHLGPDYFTPLRAVFLDAPKHELLSLIPADVDLRRSGHLTE